MARFLLALAGVLGFLAVAAGAFGAHALDGRLGEERLRWFELAARYQLLHALALFGSAWAAQAWAPRIAGASGLCFAAGILFFSGSLYAMAAGGPRGLGAVTPVGGLLLMAGWALLAAAPLAR
jgi:uncharacterized membrane protein YgdD (TMEM256/DUF423 family)